MALYAVMAVTVLVMVGAALLVLMSVVVGFVVVGLRQAWAALSRVAAAGLVPTTFEIPEFRVRRVWRTESRLTRL